MVKKLFKHEFKAYFRVLSIMYAILLGISVFGRLVQFFKGITYKTVYDIVVNSSLVMLVISSIVCVLLTLIFSIVRFYKNLFTSEGYLSFTLPVTAKEHIFVKLVTSVACQLLSLFAVVVSACIFTSGRLLYEIIDVFDYILGNVYKEVGANLIGYFIELVIFAVVIIAAYTMLFYMCIAIGQRFNKNRVLMSVVAYFVYYVITQILGTVLIITVTFMPVDEILNVIMRNITSYAHVFIIGFTVITALLGWIYYAVVNHTVRNKLNIE